MYLSNMVEYVSKCHKQFLQNPLFFWQLLEQSVEYTFHILVSRQRRLSNLFESAWKLWSISHNYNDQYFALKNAVIGVLIITVCIFSVGKLLHFFINYTNFQRCKSYPINLIILSGFKIIVYLIKNNQNSHTVSVNCILFVCLWFLYLGTYLKPSYVLCAHLQFCIFKYTVFLEFWSILRTIFSNPSIFYVN